MAGDFDDRLAAVDDALADATGERASDGERGYDERASDGEMRDGDAYAGRQDDGEYDEGYATAAGGEFAVDRDGRASTARGGKVVEGDAGSGRDAVATEVAALSDRVAELEAAVQALRGYVGSVRAVNDRVEERADAALATAEGLRERVNDLERDAARPGRGCSRPIDRRAGGHRGDESGEARDEREPKPGGRRERSTAEGASTASGGDGSRVAWPPEAPRAPYGEVDADDDSEQPGLVARLRNAL